MVEFLIYDLKVAVLIAVFYMFYRLLLSRETFHRVNRVVLLLTAVASFVLPLCVITFHKTVVVSGSSGLVSLDGFGAVMAEAAETQKPLWQTIAVAVFIVGLAVTLGHTLVGILKVWRLISRSERLQQPDGTVICITDRDVSPFSWMRYIVLSRSEYTSPEDDNNCHSSSLASVLAHERGHIHQRHSLDVLLVDTLTALQWFNPAMWMLRQDLRAIHEYEADAAVLSQGINMRQYQYLLIQKAVAACGYSVANGITHSTLKNRINMMLNKKSSSANLLKLFALVPIVGIALALNAETVNDYVYEDTQQQPQKKIVKKGRKDGQVKMNNATIEVKAEDSEKAGLNADNQVSQEKPQGNDEPQLFINGKAVSKEGIKILNMGETLGKNEPLIVINGKVASTEQLQALDPKEIDHVNVMKNEETLKHYAQHFNADTSNGIVFINTKEYVKNGKREVVSVSVKANKPEEDSTPTVTGTATPTAIGTFTANTPEGDNAFDVVEQMPQFPGGVGEMMKFLSTNVHYPEAAFKAGKEGRVLATFIVEKDGTISNVKVVKSVSEEIDAEAVRVIEAMPKWNPGKQNGKIVRVKYTIPVTFRLS